MTPARKLAIHAELFLIEHDEPQKHLQGLTHYDYTIRNRFVNVSTRLFESSKDSRIRCGSAIVVEEPKPIDLDDDYDDDEPHLYYDHEANKWKEGY